MPHVPPVLPATPTGRGRTLLAALALVAGLVTSQAGAPSSASAALPPPDAAAATPTVAPRATDEVGLLPAATPRKAVARQGKPREVGMRFRARTPGKVTGLRYLKVSAKRSATPRTGTLWSPRGKVLARGKIRKNRRTGWHGLRFDSPVRIRPGKTYVVSVFAHKGHVVKTRNGFARAIRNAHLTGRNGVVRKTRKSRFPRKASTRSVNFWVDVRFVPRSGRAPKTTPAPPSTTGFPGPRNTGVPAGTELTPYTGPCTITRTRTLSAVDATARCDALLILAPDVVIKKSRVPRVDATNGYGNSNSVTISDSDVRAGDWVDGALWGYNITATRVDVTGGQHSFHCNDNCVLTDSWLHDQYNPDGGSYHNNAFISNGGSNMVVRHNTLHCTATLNRTDGGCTANVSLFGDFEPIRNVTIDNNLLKANSSSISFCAYGGYQPAKKHPVATKVVFTDNVFERGTNNKCGVYGPVTSFQRSAPGNVWSGNVWDEGGAVNP